MNELKQTNGMDERDEQKTATKKAGNTKLGSLLPAPHRSCRQRVAVRWPDWLVTAKRQRAMTSVFSEPPRGCFHAHYEGTILMWWGSVKGHFFYSKELQDDDFVIFQPLLSHHLIKDSMEDLVCDFVHSRNIDKTSRDRHYQNSPIKNSKI